MENFSYHDFWQIQKFERLRNEEGKVNDTLIYN